MIREYLSEMNEVYHESFFALPLLLFLPEVVAEEPAAFFTGVDDGLVPLPAECFGEFLEECVCRNM